jgi:hypothetical protein
VIDFSLNVGYNDVNAIIIEGILKDGKAIHICANPSKPDLQVNSNYFG